MATLRSFVADAAHELHTPITTLRVNLDLAAEDSNHLDEYLPPAQTQVKRMQALVDSLLDLSRIEAGSGKLTRFSFSDLVRECVEKYSTLAEQSGLSFDVQISEDAVFFEGDSAQIQRAVDNILDNALKFTPTQGSIKLKLSTDQENIIFIVQDTGIGIPQDDLPNLFQRFRRGRNATAYPGSGLGLAIVKTIIDRHQGDVAVESRGKGTAVTIKLPK